MAASVVRSNSTNVDGPLSFPACVCVVVTSNMILTARDHLCMYRALLIGAKTVSKTLFLLSLTHKDVYTYMVRTRKQTTRSVQYTFDIMRGIHMAHEN